MVILKVYVSICRDIYEVIVGKTHYIVRLDYVSSLLAGNINTNQFKFSKLTCRPPLTVIKGYLTLITAPVMFPHHVKNGAMTQPRFVLVGPLQNRHCKPEVLSNIILFEISYRFFIYTRVISISTHKRFFDFYYNQLSLKPNTLFYQLATLWNIIHHIS